MFHTQITISSLKSILQGWREVLCTKFIQVLESMLFLSPPTASTGRRGLRWAESLEWTCDAGVLWVVTVVDIPSYVRALNESSFCACAFQVVQVDCATTGTKVGLSLDGFRQPAAHLPAHHLTICKIPSVITHGTPFSSQVHLHTALATMQASHEPDGSLRRERIRENWISCVFI